MTNREAYNAIVAGNITEEVIAWAQAQLDKMDEVNEKRRNSATKKELENAPLRDQIISEILTAEGKTASMIAEEMCAKGIEISHNKVTAILKKAVENGIVTKMNVKIPKKGNQKAYSIAE